jgi:biopolymer transport protein ExbD
MKLPRRRRAKPTIDMTPLIDCVFTLTIVLMLTASLEHVHLIKMALPQAVTQDQPDAPEILVSVDAQGEFYVDGERTPPDRLATALQPRIAQSKKRVVTFRGDAKIPYEWFVKALDAARAAGAVHIDVIHDLPAGPNARP